MSGLAIALAALSALGATPATPADLEKAWQSRGEPGALSAALAAYEAAARAPLATLTTFERLVRLHLFEAKTHPEGSDARAKAYERGLAAGLSGLSRFGAAGGGVLALPDAEALDAVRHEIGKPAAALFYETVCCYGLTIPSRALLSRAGAAKRFKRLLERAVDLDASVKQGGPHRSLAFFLLTAPGFLGGDETKAKQHADAALATNPRYSDNLYLHALVVPCRDRKTKAECLDELRQAAAVPDDAVPDLVPEQRAYKQKAREEARRRGVQIP